MRLTAAAFGLALMGVSTEFLRTAEAVAAAVVNPWANNNVFKPPIDVVDGQQIFFVGGNVHNVNLLASKAAFDTCSFDGATLLTDTRDAVDINGVSTDAFVVTVTAGANGFPKAGESFFVACSVAAGGHCNAQQKVQINIVAPAEVNPWVNDNVVRSSFEVLDGQQIFLVGGAAHNVNLLPDRTAFDDCDVSNAQLLSNAPVPVTLANGNAANAFVVTVTAGENGFPEVGNSFFLACSIGAGLHCQAQQKVEVKLVAAFTETGSPTIAPSTSPTAAPFVSGDIFLNWINNVPFQDQLVQAGTNIVFETTASHRVFGLTSAANLANCDFTGATELDATLEFELVPTITGIVNTTVYRVAFDGEAGKEFFVACNQGTDFAHCKSGQHFKVTIDTPTPTESPVPAPTFNPTGSPTKSPLTSSPTTSPTASPIVTLKSELPWVLGNARFSQKITLTQQEIVTFEVSAGTPIQRLPNKAAFDACDFTNAVNLGSGQVDIFSTLDFTPQFLATAAGQCELGLKTVVETVKRGAAKNIQWFLPVNEDQFALFQKTNILADQVLEFVFQQPVHNLFQFTNKAAFDACDFDDAFLIIQGADAAGITLYRDVVADVNDVIWFGCDVDAQGNGNTHCKQGMKIAFQVVADLNNGGNNGAGGGGGDGGDAPVGIIIGVIAVVLLVAVLGVLLLRRNNNPAPVSGHQEKDLEKLGAAPAAQQQHYSATPEMQKSPPMMQQPQQRSPQASTATTASATQSLASRKAQLSGLNF